MVVEAPVEEAVLAEEVVLAELEMEVVALLHHLLIIQVDG